MSTPHPVTLTFLLATRSVTSDGRGAVTWDGRTLHPVIDEAGAWALGMATGITITAEALSELQRAVRAEADGSYVIHDANGAEVPRVLTLTSAGACEPSGPPPPAP